MTAANSGNSCHIALMHIARKTNQELVVVDGTVWISVILLCFGALFAFQAVVRDVPKAWIAAGVASLFAFVAWRRETVTFDTARQQVEWARRRAFRMAGGTVPFSKMRGITLDSTTDNHGVLMYRLVIQTTEKPVPMSDAYGGGQAYYDSLRKQILEFVNIDQNPQTSPEPGDEASIRLLLQQGRKIDAIETMRSRYQLGLAEAVDRVNEIDEKMKAAQ